MINYVQCTHINNTDVLGRFDLDDVVNVCSYKYGDQLLAVIDAGF